MQHYELPVKSEGETVSKQKETSNSRLPKLVAMLSIAFIGYGIFAVVTVNKIKVGGALYTMIENAKGVAVDYAPPPGYIGEAHGVVNQLRYEKDPARFDAELKKIAGFHKDLDDAYNKWMLLTDGDIHQYIENSHKAGTEYFQTVDSELIPLVKAGKAAEAEAVWQNKLVPEFTEHSAQVDHLLDATTHSEEGVEKEAHSIVRNRQAELIILSILVAGLIVGLGVFLSRSVRKPVGAIMRSIAAMEGGDLSQRLDITTKDDMGAMARSLNRAMDNVHGVVQSIAECSERMASASEELSATANQQAEGAEHQKHQAAQVAVAMQQMASTVMQVSEHSSRAAQAAHQAAEKAKHGGKVVEDTLGKMQLIADSVGTTANRVQELGKRSEEIGQIVGVINDIAEQTNLLALNAAIEAARAGEQGRGFAVVADEVRKLAERTTEATKEIGEMIKSIQSETRTAVSAMETGTRQVEEGVDATSQAGDALQEIIRMAEQVGDMINQIATAATQQSSATEEVNQSVDRIANLVKESASGAQQSAEACQEVSGLAFDLRSLVGRFQLQGSSSVGQPAPKNKKTVGTAKPQAKSAAAGR